MGPRKGGVQPSPPADAIDRMPAPTSTSREHIGPIGPVPEMIAGRDPNRRVPEWDENGKRTDRC